MDSQILYSLLEKDFIKPGLTDDWASRMQEIDSYLTDEFRDRSMGLVIDNTDKISKVYTAVFPSEKVTNAILEKDEKEILLFVHHPAIWDITSTPDVFRQISKDTLEKLKNRCISVYNLHVPLDNHGEYSTSQSLAEALNMEPIKPFAPYFGSLCGEFCKTEAVDVSRLRTTFEKAVGHNVALYPYGDNTIKDRKVAVIAGGGMKLEMLKEIRDAGIDTFVTGITARTQFSKDVHDFAKKNRINILGGTHYSTEKFACMKMCEYFKKQGVESKFIEDSPGMEDM